MSSNGMDVTLRPGSVTYQVIGGVLDFYMFEGPTPSDGARGARRAARCAAR